MMTKKQLVESRKQASPLTEEDLLARMDRWIAVCKQAKKTKDPLRSICRRMAVRQNA